ncbi:MAG: hypothetical protein M1830_006557 [Pleopsidium flavum]|nr:MAG: hypothetical protein M1830_006557 [Pleopsidium flavum]
MSQAPLGREEPASGQESTRDKNIIREGRSPKRARTSLEAGPQPEQSRPLRGPQAGGSASSTLIPPRSPQLGGSNHNDRVRYSQGLREVPTSAAPIPSGASPGAVGAASVEPFSMPQWPLREDNGVSRRRTNSPTGERRTGKVSPPQRPPRPSHVAPFVEAPKVQNSAPAFPPQQPPQSQIPQPQYWENDFHRPPSQRSRPINTSNASGSPGQSLASSSASRAPSAPNLAAPIASPPVRRNVNSGPPPSARRGAASYYLQASYVAPIPEELPESVHKSHGSYASSHAIPSSWGSGPPDLYVGEEPGGDEEEEDLSGGDDGRESNGGDHDEASGLVRQASLGKRHKPALTTIKSSEMLRKDGVTSQTQPTTVGEVATKADNNKARPMTETASGAEAAGTVETGYLQGRKQHTAQALSGGTGLLDPSSSSDESLAKITDPAANTLTPASIAPVDPRIGQILGGLEKGGALGPRGAGGSVPNSTPSTIGDFSGIQRPSKLGLYNVRESDARNSLTSLPELIRRATRLASVLDRSRTASRLEMLDAEESGLATEKVTPSNGRRRSGSISDILASFPSPGLATPTGERPSPRWPASFNRSGLARGKTVSSLNSPSNENHERRRRRCCGMALWVFILLCVILLLLLAAAIIIPVTLIVLPRQHTGVNSGSAEVNSLASCQKSLPCGNGGTNVFNANSCRCVCVDGYSGNQCMNLADNSCVTTNVNGNDAEIKNATVGSSIPRLLQAAQSNFSIPLNSSTLLSLFVATSLSCTSENALVTFNGRSQRRNVPNIAYPLEDRLLPTPTITIMNHLLKPRSTSTVDAAALSAAVSAPSPLSNAATSNGIIFAAPSVTATSPSSAASPSSTTGALVDDRTLDFARISVLYILQETTFNTAVEAQEKIQAFLATYSQISINVSGSIVIDFGNLSIDRGNGTIVGGKSTG